MKGRSKDDKRKRDEGEDETMQKTTANEWLKVIDLYPDKAQYRPGEDGYLIAELEIGEASGKPGEPAAVHLDVEVRFCNLHEQVWTVGIRQEMTEPGPAEIRIPFTAPDVVWEGYGVEAEFRATDASGKEATVKAATALDVADHWRRAPRYGFLADFGREEWNRLEDVDAIRKFHLNVVQFYDWMYRHDDLLPPQDAFTDPMGRELYFPVVRQKLEALHERGAAAIAYGAVYAALRDFLEARPDWGLYKRNGEPFHLIDLFYIMDISPDSPWTTHIVEQFRRVIAAGFDGIHMDQYGYPKKAVRRRDGKEEIVELADCYPALINRAKQEVLKENKEAGLIFNNVSNYPVHRTATSDQDAIYIEVWAPVVHLRELKALIDRARELGEGKQVILSAYLPPLHPDSGVPAEQAENGAIVTMASIFASGGFHLLLGEDCKALTTAYYPDYGPITPSFVQEVRRYYDFIVRYGKLLFDPQLTDVSMIYTGGINEEVRFEADVPVTPNGCLGEVWSMVKVHPERLVIQLVNLCGLDNDLWAEGKKSRPAVQTGITCTVLAEKPVSGVYFASPDGPDLAPVALEYEEVPHGHGIGLRFVLPELRVWNMIYVEYRS